MEMISEHFPRIESLDNIHGYEPMDIIHGYYPWILLMD